MGANGHLSFERLWDEHAEPLFAFLYYRTHDRALAEDIVAEAFEHALRGRRRFDPRRGSERTWVYSIARNCLIDHARRNGAEERALARLAPEQNGNGHGTDELDRIEERDRVMRALATLSDEERETVALRYGGDLSVADVARVAEARKTTIEGRLYRALRKLRAELE